MPYLRINDIELYYEEAGNGVPILLAHGGFSDISEWEHQVSPLATNYRVIRYDRRGCGRSTPKDVENQPDLWIEDQRALIEGLKLDRPVIGGVSYGGMLLLEFLLKYPSYCRAAVIVSATARGVTGRVVFPDRRSVLNHIATPTLVVQGSQDTHFSVDHGKEIADSLPNARFAVLDGGHTINNQCVTEFNRTMLDFLLDVEE